MKIIRAVLGVVLLFFLIYPVAAGSTNNAPPTCRLTIDLRDGSRVIGESGNDRLKFHSALLDDLKFLVKDIRSVECVSSNSARLLTVNGDALTVWFADSEVTAKTSFGKVALPVDSIRKITVSIGGATGSRRPGLVALWSGEDNGQDSIGSNDAKLTDMDFADGQVGRAFLLNGFSSCMKIPFNSSLNIGESGSGLTISAWIKPSNNSGFHPIIEWNPSATIPGTIGVSLWIGSRPESQGVLQANIVDSNGNHHILVSPPGTIISGSFQHVAVTYDKAGGMGTLYFNGTIIAQDAWGGFIPLTLGDLWISRRPTDHPGDWTYNKFFAGLLDEIAIYNRALSTKEIQAMCMEDNHGEPLPSPSSLGMMPFRQNRIGMFDDSN